MLNIVQITLYLGNKQVSIFVYEYYARIVIYLIMLDFYPLNRRVQRITDSSLDYFFDLRLIFIYQLSQ